MSSRNLKFECFNNFNKFECIVYYKLLFIKLNYNYNYLIDIYQLDIYY